MELIVATHQLAKPGGAQSYSLTVAEQLARLGHAVTLYARELGEMAELAGEWALHVVSRPDDLPDRADGVIVGVHRAVAIELAALYPDAARVFVVHGSEDVHLPPPVPGVVAATVVLNDVHMRRAAACHGAGEVVRMRQPVDLRRFSPRGHPRDHPRNVLLLGNYHSGPAGRGNALREAWAHAGLEWCEVGGENPMLSVTEAVAQADIVVGYGRSALEAMACGRPVYVHDHSGSEGWITSDSYERLESGGFAVGAARLPPAPAQQREDLDAYRADLGQAGQDLARARHDARDHAAELVALLQRLGPGERVSEPSALRALAQLAESQLRAELSTEHYRVESKQWFGLYQSAQETLARERAATEQTRVMAQQARAELDQERENWARAISQTQAEANAAREDADRAQAQLDDALRETDCAAARLAAFKRTKRYRLAQLVAWPLDRLRRRQ